MFAVSKAHLCARSCDQVSEKRFSLNERKGTEVVPIQIKQVEREIDELCLLAFLKGCLQLCEACFPLRVKHYNFAIYNGIDYVELRRFARDRSHTHSPVQALARVESRCTTMLVIALSGMNVNLNSIAVE